jgi:hypothetical protein
LGPRRWVTASVGLNPLTYLIELLRRLLLDIGLEQVARDVAILVSGGRRRRAHRVAALPASCDGNRRDERCER